MSRLFETVTLDMNLKVNLLCISSIKKKIIKLSNMSQALLRHSNSIKRPNCYNYATFNFFFKAVLLHSNNIGAQYNVEQYV